GSGAMGGGAPRRRSRPCEDDDDPTWARSLPRYHLACRRSATGCRARGHSRAVLTVRLRPVLLGARGLGSSGGSPVMAGSMPVGGSLLPRAPVAGRGAPMGRSPYRATFPAARASPRMDAERPATAGDTNGG